MRVVLGMLLNPALLIQKVLQILPPLVVMVDTSGSMALAEPGRPSRLQQVKDYLRTTRAHLRDVFKGLDVDFGRGMTFNRLLTDDRLLPFFPPVVEDSFRLGIEEVNATWEPLIGQTIDVSGNSSITHASRRRRVKPPKVSSPWHPSSF